MTTKAMTRAHSVKYCPENCIVPRGRNSAFQLPTVPRAELAARAGADNGRKTRQKKANAVQPSIYEASSRSLGRERKKVRRTRTIPGIPKAA